MSVEATPLVSRVASTIKDAGALAAGRERLLVGARKCFAERGYGATSVQDIAEAAGISVGSLYKYVRAKEDLLLLMAELACQRLEQVVEGAFMTEADPRAALGVVVEALIRNADEDRDLMQLHYAEFKYTPRESRELILEQERDVVRRIVALIEHGNSINAFHCGDPHMAALAIVMFGSTWVLKPHLLEMKVDEYIRRQTRTAALLVAAALT